MTEPKGKEMTPVGDGSRVSQISFLINGVSHSISVEDFGPSVTLAKYIREIALLTGTKVSCNEGGCGACIVTVQKSTNDKPRSLNSCLTPVLLCDGWSVTTIEGLGDKTNGYHPIQSKLAAEGGSQCGYCSPGMVMQMHSWIQEHPNSTKLELDNILDGNICRCTGYRPILEAFKSFADNVTDIEELKICQSTGKACPGTGSCGKLSLSWSEGSKLNESFEWYRPTKLSELLHVLKELPSDTKYRIISGNTGSGVYKNDGPFTVFIDVNKISELHESSMGVEVVLGANIKITDAINLLRTADNEVWQGIAKHFNKIAGNGIRNQGSLAGNLMMKNSHTDFPSDVFLALETAGAIVEIVSSDGQLTVLTVEEFFAFDMVQKIMVRIKIPLGAKSAPNKSLNKLWSHAGPINSKASQEWKFRSYKIMPRSSNAHAYVNAGFLALVDIGDNFRIMAKPRIIFGGINSGFVHAKATEEFLIGRNMNSHDMFMEALSILGEELTPDDEPVLASSLYRKQLAMGLFYKFYLYVLGNTASSAVQSGAADLDRGLSESVQSWETDESQWPVSQPVEKTEAKVQCSGEAQYVNDIPSSTGEVHAAFVLSQRGNCDIDSVITDAALAMSGVIAYVDAKDIPGVNDWKPLPIPEPVFSSGRIEYAGQAIGLIVAESRELAIEAAKRVEITYANLGEVVTDIEKAMEQTENVTTLGAPVAYGDVSGAMASADSVISGRFKTGSQYHFYMETHVSIVTPTEDGFDVEVPTQDINNTAIAVANVMNTSVNSINVSVKRLGGGFGGKVFLQNSCATAAAVAAHKLNRPVRIWLSLEDNMKMLGKRNPYLFEYKIGFDKNRKIVAVQSDFYCDGGWNFNGCDSPYAIFFGQNCYHIPNLSFAAFGVKTHTQAHTAMRGPGMCNAHAMLENMMEQAAAELDINPLELRLNNLMEQGSPVIPPPNILDVPCPIKEIVDQIKASSAYDQRIEAASAFNEANKWKKRGISLVPMRYWHDMEGWGVKFHCLISIFADDGTISVTHGGIEMGQGLNTKVHQVVAKELGVDMSLIKIKSTMNVTNPNGITTGGSVGSEMNCAAAINACAILNSNLAPVKEKLGNGATWQDIVAEANRSNIDLCARVMYTPDLDPEVRGYSVWGCTVTEVEVDILTGEMFIVRSDIIEDAGLSTSPQVDIGQVEGAFVMGLGLWTSEQIKFDPVTGELLTKNSWEYKPPAAKDIPQDFRVTLWKNSRNPLGILSSKATGEPALLMAVSVFFAIKDAISHSRKEAGLNGWWKLDAPATVEMIHQHSGVNPEQFLF